MKKIILILFGTVLILTACDQKPTKQVKVDGEWKYSEFVEGNAELDFQNKAMVNTIVSLFKDSKITMEKGIISLESPAAGSKNGTYTINNGRLDCEFGPNNQLSLHVDNEGENLIILFNENGAKETGKIILTK